MKNYVLLTLIITLISSCGVSKKETTGNSNTDTVTIPVTSLNQQEADLVTKLLKAMIMTQDQLMMEISSLENPSQETLKKLDQYLTIDCSEVTGDCTFLSKG